VAIQNSGAVTELNTLTLTDHLTQGSNTDYTPVGPGFNDKFYLKRHTDSVNTFTITGTTTTSSDIITALSEADILKIKNDDVISGTGISGAPTITGVQSSKSLLRMSNSATANGTVTITVNSVPFGHAAHDIFCQVEVSAEGLVANSTWTPVGNDAGTYASASEDDLCVANTSQFIALLGFFNPGTAGSSDLIKGASAAYSSVGKEYGGTKVTDKGFAADIEVNPFKPANQGTTKALTVKEGEMTGTQPDGFTDQDVYLGRFVAWMKDKTVAAPPDSAWPGGLPDPEYRYITDSAEKFFYMPARSATYVSGITTVAGESLPGVGGAPAEVEPRATLPRTGISTVTARVITVDSTGSWGGNTAANTVPADAAITYAGALSGSGQGPTSAGAGGVSGSGDRNATIGSFYKLESNNFITLNHVHATIAITSNSTVTTYVLAYTNVLDGQFASYYNFTRQHVSGTSDTTDYAFVKAAATAITAVDNFRDPVL